MSARTNTKWVVAAITAMVVVAGGLAIGSNMGFKFNMPIDVDLGAAGPPAGDNRMSFPYNNPYPNASDVCTQLGLTTGGGTPASVSQFAPNGGGGAGALVGPHVCGIGASDFVLDSHRSVWITDPLSAGSHIVVGSHGPTQVVALEKGTNTQLNGTGTCPVGPDCQIPPSGDNWTSVPYHTTAVTMQDLCDDIGPDVNAVAEFDPDGGGGVGTLVGPYICGLGVGDFNHTIGRGVLVNLDNGAPATVNWIPSHY